MGRGKRNIVLSVCKYFLWMLIAASRRVVGVVTRVIVILLVLVVIGFWILPH